MGNMSQVQLTTVEEHKAFSQEVAKAYKVAKSIPRKGDRVPVELTDPSYVFLIVSMGRELDMKPLQAIQNISLIDGKPVLWGDGMIAVVRNSGLLESFLETFSDVSSDETKMNRKQIAEKIYTDDYYASCKVKRKGYEEKEYRFSVADAKVAALWTFTTDVKGKQYSPWYKYPKRMLQMRARSWALRDTFADILAGFSTVEEARDIHQQYDTLVDTTASEVVKETIKEENVVPFTFKSEASSKKNDLENEVALRCNKNEHRKEGKDVITYLDVVSEATGKDVNGVADRAMSNFEPFLKSYLKWNENED